jgi:hypothetical protein
VATTAVAVAVVGGGLTAAVAAVQPDPAPMAAATSTTRPADTTLVPITTTSVPEMTSTTTTWATTSSTPPVTSSPSTPSTTEVDGTAQAVIVAREFMARWVTHPTGMTSKEWVTQLTPFVIPEFVVELESVDPANIPATRVTGMLAVTAESPSIVEVNVPTDGGVLHLVVLAQPDGTWRVRSYDLVG